MSTSKPTRWQRSACEPVVFGIIGVGGYAGVLLDCLTEEIAAGRARIGAASVRNRSKDSERCRSIEAAGGRIFDDWKAMMDSSETRLDCVIIPTSIQAHREMAVEALKRGYNVFLEKPLAAVWEDARTIRETAERAEGGLLVGYQDVFASSSQDIKNRLLANEIGAVRSVHVLGLWPRGNGYYSRNEWAGKLRIGDTWILDSPLNNAFAHFINLPLFWLGNAGARSESVRSVSGSLYRARDIESFDTASLRFETSSGVPVDFHVSHSCADSWGPEIRIEGDRGNIIWHNDRDYRVNRLGEVEVHPLIDALSIRRAMMADVVRWVRGEPIDGATAEQAAEQTKATHLVHSGLGIHSIPPGQITDSETHPVIRELDFTFKTIYEQGISLQSEHAVWAHPPRLVRWEDVGHLGHPPIPATTETLQT